MTDEGRPRRRVVTPERRPLTNFPETPTQHGRADAGENIRERYIQRQIRAIPPPIISLETQMAGDMKRRGTGLNITFSFIGKQVTSFRELLNYVKTIELKLKYQVLNETRETVKMGIIYKISYLKHFIQKVETTKAWEAKGVAKKNYLKL